jgi:hypothetical protein
MPTPRPLWNKDRLLGVGKLLIEYVQDSLGGQPPSNHFYAVVHARSYIGVRCQDIFAAQSSKYKGCCLRSFLSSFSDLLC